MQIISGWVNLSGPSNKMAAKYLCRYLSVEKIGGVLHISGLSN